MKKYSLWQRIQIVLFGKVFIEARQHKDWKGPLPFYAFNCPEHGIVESYPTGYSGRLICPKCIDSKHEH